MTRPQLEHIIRAAGTIADTEDPAVIGSQSVLGEFPDAPPESNEADIFPRNEPSRSDLIDGTIGEGSPFQREFGYYAHGVDETTAIAKYVAGQKKVLDRRLGATRIDSALRVLVARRIQNDFPGSVNLK
jgi:hypothetical protein